VLLNKVTGYEVIDVSIIDWDIAPNGCLVIDNAHEQGKEENSYYREIFY
jgi:hypothetical protein